MSTRFLRIVWTFLPFLAVLFSLAEVMLLDGKANASNHKCYQEDVGATREWPINLGFKECFKSSELKTGVKVFLNKCGGNPSRYFKQGTNIAGVIVEVPNNLVSRDKSPYGRAITVSSTSEIELANGNKITASLSNFRDFRVKDPSGKVILQHRVSGATSIYELRHQNKNIGWALGWHKYCGEYYGNTDFTVARIVLPYLTEGAVAVSNELLSLNVSPHVDSYISSSTPIFSFSKSILSSAGASDCNYCGVGFLRVDQTLQGGFEYVESNQRLEDFGVDKRKLRPVEYLNFLSRSPKDAHNLSVYKNFVNRNSATIVADLLNYWTSSRVMQSGVKEDKSAQEQNLKYFSTACPPVVINSLSSFKDIANKCFPKYACLLHQCWWTED